MFLSNLIQLLISVLYLLLSLPCLCPVKDSLARNSLDFPVQIVQCCHWKTSPSKSCMSFKISVGQSFTCKHEAGFSISIKSSINHEPSYDESPIWIFDEKLQAETAGGPFLRFRSTCMSSLEAEMLEEGLWKPRICVLFVEQMGLHMPCNKTTERWWGHNPALDL